MSHSKPDPAAPRLEPDLAAAETHLTLLDEGAETFTFQTFDDDKRRKDRSLAVILHGSLQQHAATLAALNARGAGVFVTVNETDGKGRKLENIRRIRAVWHEEDHPCGKTFPLEPHFVVESSPGKFHRYWLVEGLTPDLFAGVMRRMVQDYGSDPNAKDLARVLRLAGFWHQKDPARPFMVRLFEQSGAVPLPTLSTSNAFPPLIEHTAPERSPAADGSHPGRYKALVTEMASRAAKRTHEDPKLGRHAMVLWLGRECAHRGAPMDWAQYAVEVFGRLMRPVDTSGKAAPLDVATEVKAFCDAYHRGLTDPAEKATSHRPPGGSRQGAASSDTVIDFAAENELRKAFKQRIDQAGQNFEVLVYQLTPEILRSTLRQATQDALLKDIAKAAGVSVGALKADRPRPPKRPDDPGPERPDMFMPELNDKHSVVSYQGRTLIVTRSFDPTLNREGVTFSSKQDFVLWYENRFTRRQGEEIDIGSYWIKSPERVQYEGVVFLPESDIPGYLNLWRGWGVGGKPGRCDKWIAFVQEVICAGDTQRFAYLWYWLCHLFQHPRELPGTAIVLRGAEGIGKSTFVETIGRLCGGHYVPLLSMQQVAGRFTDHLADAILVFANEAIWGGDKSAQGVLKAMITDVYTPVEGKNKPIRTIRNFKRLIVASNEDWVVPRGAGDRRYVIFDVPSHRKEDYAYFGAIRDELKGGGYEALMHRFKTEDIVGFRPAAIPPAMREAGWELIIQSGSSIERWWWDVLERGWFLKQPRYGVPQPDAEYDVVEAEMSYLWPDWLETETMHQGYLRWCAAHNIHHREPKTTTMKFLRRVGLHRTRAPSGEHRPWGYRFPTLDKARSLFSGIYGIPERTWEEDDPMD